MLDPNSEIFGKKEEQGEKKDIQMPTKEVQTHFKETQKKESKDLESNIVIPGITDKKMENVRKPVIMEMGSSKYTPNHEKKETDSTV